jgi:glycosyltransferase involved in cell wall biosynthesis
MGMAGVETEFQAELKYLRESSLFQPDFVLARNAALAASGFDPLEYFCRQGFRRGEWPNPYFDPAYYLARNQDVAQAGVNPLLHFLAHGDREGRDPCGFFHVKWYRAQYAVKLADNTLAHFLARRASGEVAPVPFFDPIWYFEQNPDVAANGGDPFEHFLAFGAPEMRDPSPSFDMKFYVARYGALLEGQNPLLHFLENRESGKFVPARPEHEKLIPGAVRTATRPSADFEEFRPVASGVPRRAKILAFYLPQFHAVPENDAWWGKGFTDWTNLLRAVPRFAGHLQPRVPRDLGFYNLADPAVLRRQVEMALGAGLHGFVFYYYWFNGKRLLDGPLNLLRADPSIEMPFCVMWANENFTRRWDGLEREILLAQEYREADDPALIDGFLKLFADDRYIRIAGRPLLMIYRAALVPDAARRIAAWRNMFAQAGEDPLLVMAQSIGDYDPRPYGLDGAIEFPPHKISDEVEKINDGLDLFDPEFAAAVFDYTELATASAAVPAPSYPLIRSAAPGWDNEPRREGKGLVLHRTSPAAYQDWLEKLVDLSNENPFFGEPLIGVNAWNEWAEGAFLEPDIHFGGAFLNATSRAVCGTARRDKTALVLVGHDAQPHGAQLLLLNLAKHYAQVCGFEVHVLLLGAGRLVQDYQKIADVTLANDKPSAANFIKRMAARGAREAIVNSAAAARLVPALRAAGLRVTLLIHEMPKLLAEYNLQIAAKMGAQAADNVVFASKFGGSAFCGALDIRLPDAVILPQGNYQNISFDPARRTAMRQQLGIADNAFLVLGLGFGDFRKGFDLFLQIASKSLTTNANIHFAWVGEIQPTLKTYLADEIAAARATRKFHLAGFSETVEDVYAAADIFALTSREDPYPTVALEALAAGIPVVAFEGAGGIPELLREEDGGAVAKAGDIDDFQSKIHELLDRTALDAKRPRLSAMAAQKFDQRDYARRLIGITRPAARHISACVLNYNYARYLRGRLAAIFAQYEPVCEILMLDDASDDESVALTNLVAADAKRAVRLVVNAHNSGSVFAQWRRAARAATGEFVWLAEADDEAEPDFLTELLAAMTDPATVMAFSDSAVIGAAGQALAPDYQTEYRAAGADLSSSKTWPGADFARTHLAVQNLIFNVSAVLWRRDALLAALERCPDLESWSLAGDWRLYLEILTAEGAKIAYVATPLNRHRRHQGSVTTDADADRHLAEIRQMQDIAAGRLRLDDATRRKQGDYVESIAKQFGDAKRQASASFFAKKEAKKL